MKKLTLIAAAFVFAAFFASNASGQGNAQPAGSLKVVLVNTSAFDAKDGITRYINAMNSLEAEFKPIQVEIEGMLTKYQNLGNEIKKLQDTVAAGQQVPISSDAIRLKVEEYQSLETNIKRKQEDGKRRADLRQAQVLGPIQEELGKALQDFANQKGYDLILDVAKLASDGSILALNPAKIDVTKEFITFFNARPATAATAAAPR